MMRLSLTSNKARISGVYRPFTASRRAKALLATALGLILALTLSGCGQNLGGSPGSSSNGAAESSASTDGGASASGSASSAANTGDSAALDLLGNATASYDFPSLTSPQSEHTLPTNPILEAREALENESREAEAEAAAQAEAVWSPIIAQRERCAYENNLAGVVYLGSVDVYSGSSGDTPLPRRELTQRCLQAARSSDYVHSFPFLKEMPDTQVVIQDGGDDLFLIFPTDINASLWVYAWISGPSNNYRGEDGQLLYSGSHGRPILLLCNEGDASADVHVYVQDSYQRVLSWLPRISLIDNHVMTVYEAGYVTDFTVYTSADAMMQTYLVGNVSQLTDALGSSVEIRLGSGTYTLEDHGIWLRDVDRLTIRGTGAGATRIVVENPESDALRLTGCSQILLEDLTLTFVEPATEGCALALDDCEDVTLVGVTLEGGRNCLTASGAEHVTLSECTLRGSDSSLVRMEGCHDFTIEKTRLTQCDSFAALFLADSELLCRSCTFSEITYGGSANRGLLYLDNECSAQFALCQGDKPLLDQLYLLERQMGQKVVQVTTGEE